MTKEIIRSDLSRNYTRGFQKGKSQRTKEVIEMIGKRISWLKVQRAKPFINNYSVPKINIAIRELEELKKQLGDKAQ